MSRKLPSLGARLSYANVTATLALFIALGGGFAIAAAVKKNTVKSSSVRNETLTNKDLKDNKAVGSSEVVDESLGSGDLGAGSVGAAEIADGQVGAAEIADGQVGAGELADPEAFHVVGAAGEPAFGTGDNTDCIWSDAAAAFPGFASVGFYKDPDGRVHLAGIPVSNDGTGGDALCDNTDLQERFDDFRVFTLPPAYRPGGTEEFVTTNGDDIWIVFVGGGTDTSFGGLATVRAGGVYVLTNSTTEEQPGGVALSGISFRAAGAATAAAPAADQPPPPRDLLGIGLR